MPQNFLHRKIWNDPEFHLKILIEFCKLADLFEVSVDYLLNRDTRPLHIHCEPQKNSNVTEEYIKEIQHKAESLNNLLMSGISLVFAGKSEDEETLELVLATLEECLVLAKQEVRKKYTSK